MAIIIGRKNEQNELNKALSSEKGELIALIGRRRVGKTYLVQNYFKDNLKLEVSGLQNTKMEVQIGNFVSAMKASKLIETVEYLPQTWSEAFELLKEKLVQIKNSQKYVLFFDELPWLAGKKTDFVAAFDFFWNNWAAKQNIVIVICGSSASWMNQKIINHKGGLHNRITRLIYMKPFNLTETALFLKAKNINYPQYQILQLYMAIGGIPLYLDLIEGKKSVSENINALCMQPSGFLYDEYNRLLPSLFLHHQVHSTIIEALAKKRKGLTREELLSITKLPNGGTFTHYLEELIQSDFVDFYKPFGKQKKEILYRLSDMYCLFYFEFILPNKGNKTPDFMALSQTQGFKSWQGYTFENICMSHIYQIKKALGISGISTITSSFIAKPKDGLEGTQIDLLIERMDNCIHLCEIKFHSEEFILTKAIAENLRKKKTIFNYHTQNKKHIFNTIITTYGVFQNDYSLGTIDQVISMDKLFEE